MKGQSISEKKKEILNATFPTDKSNQLVHYPDLKIEVVALAQANSVFDGVLKDHPDWTRTYHPQGIIAPNGDHLIIFAWSEEGFFGHSRINDGDIILMRSKDKGKTWEEPAYPYPTDYIMHAATFLNPRGTNDIYAFGTEPIPELREKLPHRDVAGENCPVGYRVSSDNGYSWSKFNHIKPVNDPDLIGFGVLPMTETHAGTWLYGITHLIDGYDESTAYVLRSTDKGKSWTCLPDAQPNGFDYGFYVPNEVALITCENGDNLLFARNQSGDPATLFLSRSTDDGRTWSEGVSVPELPHSAAPPAPYLLSDGKTIIVFIDKNPELRRSEIWFTISKDNGYSWSEVRFLQRVDFSSEIWRHSTKYPCVIAEDGILNVYLSYGWDRIFQYTIKEDDLEYFPTSIPGPKRILSTEKAKDHDA